MNNKFHSHLQLTWDNYPVCMLPESLYGTPIIELNPPELEWCMHLLYNDPYDAFSYNSLLARGMNQIVILKYSQLIVIHYLQCSTPATHLTLTLSPKTELKWK